MSRRLLYLFGEPGTGKITVARVLKQRLGWRLFWLHDLDPVCAIVGRYPLPRLMDRISEAVLEELMVGGEDLIYVRPSRDAKTRRGVAALAVRNDYRCIQVQLKAPYETLVERVTMRGRNATDRFRIGSKEELDRYLNARPTPCSNVFSIDTAGKTPEQVASEVQVLI